MGIPKNKLNKLNKKYKNIDIQELKNINIWKSYIDSLSTEDILQIIVNELK